MNHTINQLAEECYNKWYNLFFKVSMSITKDREATRDLIQNAFLYVLGYSGDKEIKELGHVKALVHIHLRYASLSYIKGNKKKIQPEDAPAKSVSNYLLDMWPASIGIFRNLSKLTTNQQSIVKFYYWDGMSVPEISQRTGRTNAACWSNIKGAIKQLKNGCQDTHKVPDNRDGKTDIIIDLFKSGNTATQIADQLNKNPKTISSRLSYYRKTQPALFN